MNKHEDCKRAYVRTSKAYYSKSFLDQPINIMIGMYNPNGGSTGDFKVEWINLGESKGLAARLQVFDDAWSALMQFQDLLKRMSDLDGQNIQEPEFAKVLDSLGIIDITEYKEGEPANVL